MNYKSFFGLLICIISILILIVWIADVKYRGNNNVITQKSDYYEIKETVNYVRPEIPSNLEQTIDRANYYVLHYWNKYSLADTAFITSDKTEQLYVDFIDALKYSDKDQCFAALQRMMNHMEKNHIAYHHFISLNEKYLYDPNSPMRNEDYYIAVLKQMMSSKTLSEDEKLRPELQLKSTQMNRPGMVAADFHFVTTNGISKKMSNLKGKYLILFFYDPDCNNCRENEMILSKTPIIDNLIKNGSLVILAIYPYEERDKWMKNSSRIPKKWIVGWDKHGTIRKNLLYDIRATPTIYLLDKDKKVILKDVTSEIITQYLTQLY